MVQKTVGDGGQQKLPPHHGLQAYLLRTWPKCGDSDTALNYQFDNLRRWWYSLAMLDWYSGLIGYDAEALKLGRLYEVSPDGEVMYSTERWVKAKGSYEASVQVKRDSSTPAMRLAAERLGLMVSPTVLQVSGNPVKFLQGHNAFGPSVSSLGTVIQAFARALPLDIRPIDSENTLWPALHRSRVDITVMVDLGSDRNVHDWLRHAATDTRSRHGIPDRDQRGLTAGDTVYWGKHSRRWTMKAYCKFCELKAHPCPDMEMQRLLREFVEGQLRLELTLRRPELKNRGTLDEGLVWEYFERIGIGVMKMDVRSEKPKLKAAVENVLDLWLSGADVRARLPQATFYRYRRMIVEEVGVDISLDRHKQDKAIERVKFDLEYLKANEVKNVPEYLQGWLLKPEMGPVWAAR
ncbi:phage/plasmid replication protein, II/X family [Chloroflexota bacterium]